MSSKAPEQAFQAQRLVSKLNSNWLSWLEFTRPSQASQETPSVVGRIIARTGCTIPSLMGNVEKRKKFRAA
jgi:hypothetical protein